MEKDERFEIFYVRHGDTSGAGCGDRSKCDVDLTELGLKQAELLGERFAGAQFDAVYSSPLVRCVRTAAATLKRLGGSTQLIIMPELIENGTVPGYPGADIDYLKRYWENIRLCEDEVYGLVPNQNDEQNDARAKLLTDYFKSKYTYGQKILVFCHGSFGNHFIPAAVDMLQGDFVLSLNNTSVSKMKFTPDGRQRLSFCNDVSHLRNIMPDFDFTV